ncbi:trypsin-like serine protease, partial [Pseudoxanthomonas mexicana]
FPWLHGYRSLPPDPELSTVVLAPECDPLPPWPTSPPPTTSPSLQLAEPVDGIQPVAIYAGDTMGKVVRIVGKGATGTGARGHDPQGPNRTELRHAFNTITRAEGRWLEYVFDAPPSALQLEGMAGNGDSGGPMLVGVNGHWELAGLTSWKRVDGNPATFRPGIYGQISYGVRLGHYIDWIDDTHDIDNAQCRRPARITAHSPLPRSLRYLTSNVGSARVSTTSSATGWRRTTKRSSSTATRFPAATSISCTSCRWSSARRGIARGTD